MITISKLTLRDDADDEISHSKWERIPDAIEQFDRSANSIVVRCDNDDEYFGILYGVRKANGPIAEEATKDLEPGKIAENVMVWQFKGQLVDGAGWRLIYGREPTRIQKAPLPAEKKEPKGSALGNPAEIES